MYADDSIRSLLCSFGSWYNGSDLAERRRRLSDASNSSPSQMDMFVREWKVFQPPRQMGALQLSPVICFLAMSLVAPVLLVKVLSSPRLRQETRYLLLANVLLSDLVFVSLYVLSTALNVSGVLMSEGACAALLFLLAALYTAGTLSTKVAVLDTSLAVLAPLRYVALWPVSRTRCAIAAIWLLSALFPASAVGVFLWHHSAGPCASQICSLPLLLVLTVSRSTPMQVSMLVSVAGILVILLLVFSGYVALYCQTRRSGIWRAERTSRAKGTFLIHYLHLFLSFCPMLVLTIELLLFSHRCATDLRTNLWVCLVICNVLLVLPKALAPYLYGLRYRELRRTLLEFYELKRRVAVSPVV